MAATVVRAAFPLLAACCSWAVTVGQPTAAYPAAYPAADFPDAEIPVTPVVDVAASYPVDRADTPTGDSITAHTPKNPIVWRIPASSQINTMMDIAKVKQQIKEVRKEVEAMDSKVAVKQQEVDSMKGDYLKVVAQHRAVTEKLESAEHAIRDVYLPKYMVAHKQIQELQAAIESRKAEKTYKMKHLNKMEEERAKLQNKYAEMAEQQEKLSKQQQSIDQFKSENTQMEKELAHGLKEEKEREAQIEALKQEINRLKPQQQSFFDMKKSQVAAPKRLRRRTGKWSAYARR